MALVKARTTIFSVLSTVYTAVTFHELFKEAAMDANRRLDFGVEWQEIFNVLQGQCDVVGFDDEYLREKFDAIDDDGSGELDEGEMRALFESMGRPVSKRVVANIMRLSDTDGNGMFFLLMSFIIYYATCTLTYESITYFDLIGTIDFGEFKAIFDQIACVDGELAE